MMVMFHHEVMDELLVLVVVCETKDYWIVDVKEESSIGQNDAISFLL
jgi:hypothetical protein